MAPTLLYLQYFTPSVFSAKANDMTKKEEITIQSTAPAPPVDIATATPIMFPIPIDAPREVDNDCSKDILLLLQKLPLLE